jgi:hypothetical protein
MLNNFENLKNINTNTQQDDIFNQSADTGNNFV